MVWRKNRYLSLYDEKTNGLETGRSGLFSVEHLNSVLLQIKENLD